MKDLLTEEFLQSIREIEGIFSAMYFKQYSFEEKGRLYIIQYKSLDTIVEFLFGPPEFQIEMIVYVGNKKYAFRDLLQFSKVAEWVKSNRYVQRNGRSLKDEMLWFSELLKFSLPFL